MENSNRISYSLLGIGIGIAVGMLFAPKAGAETRNFLKTKVRDTADALKCEGQYWGDRAVETIERGKQSVEGQVKKLSDAVDGGIQAFRETVERARPTVEA